MDLFKLGRIFGRHNKVFHVSLTAIEAVCLLVLPSLCVRGNNDEVFSSTAHMMVLAKEEMNLLESVSKYIDLERQRLDHMQSLAAKIQEIHSNPMLSSVGNPINAFRLIQRFHTTWNDIHQLMSQNGNSIAVFEQTKSNMASYWPTSLDFEGAQMALIRLQKTYDLNTTDLLAGRVAEQDTSQPLSQQDALDIASSALKHGYFDESLDWLTHAQNHQVPPLSSKKDILIATGNTYLQKGLAEQTVEASTNESDDKMVTKMPPTIPKADWPFLSKNYASLCQSVLPQTSPPEAPSSNLFCLLKRSPFVPFHVFKVEYFHRSPDVVLFRDFTSDAESAALIDIAVQKLQRARVGRLEENVVSDVRIGKIAWFWDGHGDVLIDRISRRTADATDLNTKNPASEPFQLRFARTYDELSDDIKNTGDRIATFMIYLNDVDMGGGTVFPKLNLAVQPVKNSAIFWYNYRRSGEQDERSLHAACPVLIGQKWVANKWIRERGQEFLRPCELNMD